MTEPRIEIEGVVRIFRYANYRRGAPSTTVSRCIADVIAPLPASTIWTLTLDTLDYAGQNQFLRTKSGRAPQALADAVEGERVRFSGRVEWWDNTLGGYLTDVRSVTKIGVSGE